MAAYRRGMTYSHLRGLPVHRDQLRAQRSVMSMGELYLYYTGLFCLSFFSKYVKFLDNLVLNLHYYNSAVVEF